MNSVTALRELQKNSAPNGYLWCRFTMLADGMTTLYDRLAELCEVLGRQLESIDRVLAAHPDATRQAALTEVAEASRYKLLEVGRLLAAEHDRWEVMRRQRFGIYGDAEAPSDQSRRTAKPEGSVGQGAPDAA